MNNNNITKEDREKVVHIQSRAPVMLEQGQFIALQNLINALPENLHSPWIIYWSACASLPINPQTARQRYELALDSFVKELDLTGVFLSWAGIVDSFIFAWDDFKPLDHWIQWMQDFMQQQPGFPSPEIEAHCVFAMFCSLMYRQPQHPELAVWSSRLGDMLEHIPDKNRRIAIATHYALYLGWMGDFEELTAVVERLKPSATINYVQPVHLIAWYQTEAMHNWLIADFAASKKSVQAGLDLAESSGIHLWDFILRVQDAYLALESTTPDKWKIYLQNILSIMDENGRLHQAHYYYLAALEALLQHRFDRSLLHINKSLQAVIDLGTPYPEALNCIAKGRILIEQNRYQEALIILDRAGLLAQQMNSHFLTFNLQLTRAELLFAQQDKLQAVVPLSEALAIGRSKKYFNTDWWRAETLCRLCMNALENNIEVDYVQQLIIRRKLFPHSPPFKLENWPWKVRIYTLGRFSVLLNNQPLTINGNAKNKPIELLKALVAMGGRDVNENRITEALWPDAEGDHAHSAYTTTLSRLRKLLGSDVLQVQNANLSLNDHTCWLDSWAFERTLGELEALISSSGKLNNIQYKMQKVFGLYHGLFMEREPQMGWMLPQRERLRAKLLRIIKQLISFYSSNGHCRKVITLYEKAQEMDPLSEEYYCGLMKCHAAQGNSAKALAVFDVCQTILHETFGIKPSAQTKQLHQLIQAGDQHQLKRICELCAHSEI